jgi:hypothetical protein
VTQKRLEIAELVRRIHIGQQPFAAKQRDLFPVDHVHSQVFTQFHHLQAALHQSAADGRMAGASIDCTQRMISAFGPRDDSIHRIAQRHKTFEEAGSDERHVARHEDHPVVARRSERRIEAAQRAGVRHAVGDATPPWDRLSWITAHEQNIVGQLAEFVELAVEDSPAADEQGALVAPVEPACATAGENRGAGHNFSILPPA